MPEHVTDIIQRYRMALQFVWNSCIWPDVSLRDWETHERFKQLHLPLYRAIVGNALDLEPETLFGPEFAVTPQDATGFRNLQVNTVVSRTGGGVWSNLVGPFRPGDLQLTLLDFFDWGSLQYQELRYFRVSIVEFASHPQWVGHEALVEVVEADVFWSPPSSTSLTPVPS